MFNASCIELPLPGKGAVYDDVYLSGYDTDIVLCVRSRGASVYDIQRQTQPQWQQKEITARKLFQKPGGFSKN